MEKDKRTKGCPNESCAMHADKKKQSADNEYCPKCGSKLILVCEKCFTEIEDIDYNHKRCKRGEAEAIEKKEKAKETAKNIGGKVVAVGASIVSSAAAAMQTEAGKQAANAGKKVVKEAVKNAPKVLRK